MGPQKLARGLQQLGTHGSPMLEAFYHPKEAQKRSYAAVASEAQPIRPAPKKAKRPRPAAVGGPTATCGSQCGCCAPEGEQSMPLSGSPARDAATTLPDPAVPSEEQATTQATATTQKPQKTTQKGAKTTRKTPNHSKGGNFSSDQARNKKRQLPYEDPGRPPQAARY